MEEVGRGVVGGGQTAFPGVDFGFDFVADLQGAEFDFDVMEVLARWGFANVEDAGGEGRARQGAVVGDLAAGFGIEGRFV